MDFVESMPPTPASPPGLLPDLDLSMSPTYCDEKVGLPEAIVKNIIRNTAILLYSHEKLTTIWKRNVRNGRPSLLTLINRVELSRSPRVATAPPSPSMLKDLADFEALYYGTCCKIRELYADIQLRVAHFGAGMLDVPLHCHGDGFALEGELRMVDMARLLLIHWDMLTDPGLIATLDHAVRERRGVGLWDTNRLPVGAVMALVWDRERAESEALKRKVVVVEGEKGVRGRDEGVEEGLRKGRKRWGFGGCGMRRLVRGWKGRG